MKRIKLLLTAGLVAICLLWAGWGPIIAPVEEPTRAQCDRMTTKALFLTVLETTKTTNLAYVEPWPEFLEMVSESYYPLRALEARADAAEVIEAYMERVKDDDELILKYLKAECLLNHVNSQRD